jgi:hypothetical protein
VGKLFGSFPLDSKDYLHVPTGQECTCNVLGAAEAVGGWQIVVRHSPPVAGGG